MNIWKNDLISTQQTTPDQAELIPLTEHTLLAVRGADHRIFLQGQCTCNVEDVSGKRWLAGAHCNHKGRMHSSFLVAQVCEDALHLRLNKNIFEHAKAALAKYAVFSKVELEQAADYFAFALSGSETNLQRILASLSIDSEKLNSEDFTAFEQGCALVLQSDLIEIWAKKTHIEDILRKISSYVYSLGAEQSQNRWNLKMIQSGRAEVLPTTVEKLLPQEINFQCINGISFKKGCYTGQEVIARLNYRAQLKKHMYRGTVKLPTTESLEQAQLVTTTGKKVGDVLLSASLNQDHYELLALVNDDAVENESVTLNIPSKPVLEWLPLPYAIT